MSVKINWNEVAKEATILEGLKSSLKIGDVKEIIGYVVDLLDDYEDEYIVKAIRKLAETRRKKASKKK
jgi:hypothetical protein